MNGIMNRCQEEMNRRVDQEGMNGRMDWLGNVSVLRRGMYRCQKGIYVKRRKEHVSREELKGQ